MYCYLGSLGPYPFTGARLYVFFGFRHYLYLSKSSASSLLISSTPSKMAPSLIDEASTGTSSSHIENSKALKPGIYVPTVAFFSSDEEVDVETTKNHAIFLAQSGVTGLVTHGSNGEAVHLDHEERMLITKTTREALDSAGYANMPVIVGCGAHSTREVIKLCRDAAASGGDYALVLPPSYYGPLLNSELILNHFRNVADASPIPLMIYNYPGAVSGLDLNSDQILELAQHPKIVGVKLTCGNTGKLARIAAAAPPGFLTTGGSADFILQTLVVGGHGVIAGLGNIAPKACIKTMQLYEQGAVKEAREMQAVVARGDWVAIKGGFVAVKVALEKYQGYGGLPRLPTAMPVKSQRAEQEVGFAELMQLENSL
ncbi:hypothetical protein M8818_003729 [Zalaria obscura]|uniref:Uncharacterized protein n=1 Tax=Zalaria obscura TaxID=2024903 RepID=A0ACC3SEJ5_9PEZI